MMRIKQVRLENNISQIEMGKILGVARSTYVIWESELVPIPLFRLIIFCDYFALSMDYVLGLTKTKSYQDMLTSFNKKLCAKRIKEIRLENKYTQDKLAKKLNTDNGVISRYEHGQTVILTTFLREYAKIFSISTDYLLGRINRKIILKQFVGTK